MFSFPTRTTSFSEQQKQAQTFKNIILSIHPSIYHLSLQHLNNKYPKTPQLDNFYYYQTHQMQVQPSNSYKKQLIYSSTIDKQKTYLFKVDQKFIQDLQNNSQLIIQGQSDDPPIIHSTNNLYRIKGINLSTTFLVIDHAGTIYQETNNYLDVQKYDPPFHQIYKQLSSLSCKFPNTQQTPTFEALIENHSFTDFSVCKKFYLNEQNFNKLSKAMNLLKIQEGMKLSQSHHLHLAVWIMRQIISVFQTLNKSLFTQISKHQFLESINLLNNDILTWISTYFSFNNNLQTEIQMTTKTITRFIICQMALAKKQYNSQIFDQVLEQMIMIYMPAQAQINTIWFKDNSCQKQDVLSCKYDYFIQIKGNKYIYYDYMELQSEISATLKFLSGFKKRWKLVQLTSIFRGIESTQNGKPITLQEILIKKFRKYGEQYEIKFILPNQ